MATPTVKRTRKAISNPDGSFQLLLSRFDRVDKDNDDIKTALGIHVQEAFTPLKQKVDQHGTYWGLLIGLGTPVILAVMVAYAQGWIH